MNPTDEQARRARLSAIMDGQADEAEVQRWLQDDASIEAVQEDWHTYHLIGDVMRSADLATGQAHDQRLVLAVREALQNEPVVVAPTALPAAQSTLRHDAPRATRPRWRLWGAAAAAVAGVGVVLSTYLVTRVDANSWGSVVASVVQPAEDIRRASLGAAAWSPSDGRWTDAPPSQGSGASPGAFREILRLPRGPASKPMESVQVLYSNGSATISVTVESFRPGEHQPRTETSERLNTLTVQRQGTWLTLSGDVPLGTLQQMALALPLQP